MSRPRTRAGWQLRSLLAEAPKQRTGGPQKKLTASLAWFPVSRSYGGMAAETLTILIRRRFTTRPDTEISQYARDVTLRTGRRAGDEFAKALEATIKAGAGQLSALAGMKKYTMARAQMALLRDLTRSMTPDEVDEIIAFAELRRERQSAGPAAARTRPSRVGGSPPSLGLSLTL